MKIQLSLLCVCLLVLTEVGLAVPITVEVVDEKGAPVAGALVLVRPDTIFVPGDKAPTQTTGADGLAQFDLESSKIRPGYFGQSVVFKAGYGVGGGDLKAARKRVALRASEARSGRVTDLKGAPIVGANVELTYLHDAGSAPFDDSILLDDEIKAQLPAQTRATTDKNGVWKLKDLPVNSEFGLRLMADNFADVALQLRAGTGEIEIKLAPEARINGQLLAPDGTPLVGVTVRVVPKERFERQGGQATTDAQGRFAVSGLSAATYSVNFKIEDQPFIAAKIEDFGARVGDNALPTVTAQTGVVVRGTVRTNQGQPAQVASISVNGGGRYAGVGPDGAYEIRVLPGENTFSLDVGNDNYSNARDKKTLQITAGDAPVLDWTLQTAPLLRGTLTDEKGAPLQAKLYLTGAMSNDVIEIQSDKDGHFEAPVPFEGEATFGDSIWDSAQWDVVGRQTVKLPFRGELKLVAKPTVRRIFQTRVVDENGAPIAGVQLNTNVWEGQSGRSREISSDENGILRIENITPKQSITNATIAKDGYQLRGELKIIDNGGDITTGPIVMVKSAATARGTVINAAGENAVRARVSAAGIETITGENGAFALDNLPAGELRIAAISADEQTFGAAKLPLQAPIQLQTPKLIERDRVLAQSIMGALKVEARDTDYWAKDQLDFPNADFVARVRDSADPIVPFYDLDTDASISAARALEAFALLNQSDDVLRAAAQIISWRPDWKDEARAGEFVARLEEDVANEMGKAANANSLYNAAGVYALAAAYEAQGASESADRALKDAIDWTWKTFQAEGDQSRETAMMFSAQVFAATPRLMEKLLTFFDPESYDHHRTLVDTLRPLANARGLSALVPVVAMISQLPDSRETTTLDRKTSYYVKGNLLTAGIQIIRDNGARDPAGALKIADLMRENPDYGQSDERNRAFAEAAFWQPSERAAEIWREQLLTMKPENAVEYAARIQKTNPDLARELYGVAREQFEAKLPLAGARKDISSTSFYSIEIGKFAFYEAQFEPSRALYRIERAWDSLDKDNQNYGKLRDLAAAMGRLDPQRALEMANGLATRDQQFGARRKLALQLWDGQLQRE